MRTMEQLKSLINNNCKEGNLRAIKYYFNAGISPKSIPGDLWEDLVQITQDYISNETWRDVMYLLVNDEGEYEEKELRYIYARVFNGLFPNREVG